MTLGIHHDVADRYAGDLADAFQVAQVERSCEVLALVPVILAEAAGLGEFLDGPAAVLLESDSFAHDLLCELRDFVCFHSHGSHYSQLRSQCVRIVKNYENT